MLQIRLTLAAKCKYLGPYVDIILYTGREVSRRRHQLYRPPGVLKRATFACRAISLEHQLTYAGELCAPHLAYNARAWPKLTVKQQEYVDVTRGAAPRSYGPKFSGLPCRDVAGRRLLNAFGQPPVSAHARLRRLSLDSSR